MPVEAKHSHWLYREAKTKEMAVSTIEHRLCFFYGAILHPRKKKLVFGVGTKKCLPYYHGLWPFKYQHYSTTSHSLVFHFSH